MWFKNVRAYRLTSSLDLNPEQLEQQLQSQRFSPCGKSQALAMGWVAPLGENTEALVHAAAGRYLLCLRREEKLLPASVVREQLTEKISAVEREEARKVYRKEKSRLKDEIIQDCLLRAFSRSSLIYAYFDTSRNWLFVDSASAARAEELINTLRECIGTLPLVLPRVNQSPAAAISSWLLHRNLPPDFLLKSDCDMRDPGEEGGVVRCRGIELVAQNDDLPEAGPLARLDADFALMSNVVSVLQERLIELSFHRRRSLPGDGGRGLYRSDGERRDQSSLRSGL